MPDIDSLKQALAISPENIPLLQLLGDALIEEFHLEEALDAYRRIVALEPGHPAARTRIAHIIELQGRTSEAIVRLEQVCAEHPGYAPAWLLRSKLSLSEGDARQARDYYEQAVKIDPTLASGDLLKRIRQAGGGRTSPPSTDRASAQATSSHQANAYYDQDYDDTFDDEEDFTDEDESEFEFESPNGINFSQVGGMEDVKESIRMKILYPMENRALFEAYGKKAGGGVLLYGPPGCGKTMISRATAGEINAKFLCVGLHQILDMWIGKSEEKLHELFELARHHAPSVIFFDEVDALAADRKDLRASAGRTLINQFLSELDNGASDNDGVLIIGATNAPWHLDSAFLRPGRFDRMIFVPPPDETAREQIIRLMAEGRPVTGLDARTLAKKVKDFSGADIKALFEEVIEETLAEAMRSGKIVPMTQKQLMNAAKRIKPSTRKWFESARNYALYANQSGVYDEILQYLGLQK